MRNLKTLSVCYCGLTDLDGINNLPSLVNLVAAFNAISDIYPVTEMRKLKTLDLERYHPISSEIITYVLKKQR